MTPHKKISINIFDKPYVPTWRG